MYDERMKKNQNGFSLIEGLLVIVVFAVIGTIMLYVFNARNNPTTSSNAKQTSSAYQPPAEQTDNDGTYLTISDWGVKLLLNDITRHATYSFADSAKSSIYLSTPRLDELSAQIPGCSLANQSVSVLQLQPGQQFGEYTWSKEKLEIAGVEIGNYYYLPGGGDPCSFKDGQNPAGYQTAVDELNQIRAALANLQSTVVAK